MAVFSVAGGIHRTSGNTLQRNPCKPQVTRAAEGAHIQGHTLAHVLAHMLMGTPKHTHTPSQKGNSQNGVALTAPKVCTKR